MGWQHMKDTYAVVNMLYQLPLSIAAFLCIFYILGVEMTKKMRKEMLGHGLHFATSGYVLFWLLSEFRMYNLTMDKKMTVQAAASISRTTSAVTIFLLCMQAFFVWALRQKSKEAEQHNSDFTTLFEDPLTDNLVIQVR